MNIGPPLNMDPQVQDFKRIPMPLKEKSQTYQIWSLLCQFQIARFYPISRRTSHCQISIVSWSINRQKRNVLVSPTPYLTIAFSRPHMSVTTYW